MDMVYEKNEIVEDISDLRYDVHEFIRKVGDMKIGDFNYITITARKEEDNLVMLEMVIVNILYHQEIYIILVRHENEEEVLNKAIDEVKKGLVGWNIKIKKNDDYELAYDILL